MGATDRILQFIKYKGITKYRFCKDLGFSNKFLDNNSNIGTDKACKIIQYYVDMNPEWLLTGVGPMLRELNVDKNEQSPVNTEVTEVKDTKCKQQIQSLQQEITLLKENINLLKENKILIEKENKRLVSENEQLQQENIQLRYENRALQQSQIYEEHVQKKQAS